MPQSFIQLINFGWLITMYGRFSQRHKGSAFHRFGIVAGVVCCMVLGTVPPAIAQSKTLTLEEISQKLQVLEAYQKKMKAEIQARQKNIDAYREEQDKKHLARLEARQKRQETLDKRFLQEGMLPGFIKFPGTETQFRFGGFARTEAIRNFNNMKDDDITAFYNRDILTNDQPSHKAGGNTFFNASASRLNFDARTDTSNFSSTFNELKVFIEGDFWPDASGLRVRHAFGDWGPLLVGETWDVWQDVHALPFIFDFGGPASGIGCRTPQVRWTQPLGDGFSLIAAFENPDTEITVPANAEDETRMPDFIMVGTVEGKDWHFRLSSLLRDLNVRWDGVSDDSALGWGLNFSGKFPTIDKDSFGFSMLGGKGLGHYINATQTTNADAVIVPGGSLHTIAAVGGQANYTHHWTDTLQSNIMYSHVWNDNRSEQPDSAIHKVNYLLNNLVWNPYPLIHVGVEYLYGTRENKNGSYGQAHRLTFGFIYLFHKDPSLKNWWFGGGGR